MANQLLFSKDVAEKLTEIRISMSLKDWKGLNWEVYQAAITNPELEVQGNQLFNFGLHYKLFNELLEAVFAAE